MINWIRRQFCNHKLELVHKNVYDGCTVSSYICKKCGYIRRVETSLYYCF